MQIEISPKIQKCLQNNYPIIALDCEFLAFSTSYPDNVQIHNDLENIMICNKVIPAPIAILNGKIKVGLSESEIELIGQNASDSKLITQKDLSSTIGFTEFGITSTSATLSIASSLGIQLYVCKSMNGVERGAE